MDMKSKWFILMMASQWFFNYLQFGLSSCRWYCLFLMCVRKGIRRPQNFLESLKTLDEHGAPTSS